MQTLFYIINKKHPKLQGCFFSLITKDRVYKAPCPVFINTVPCPLRHTYISLLFVFLFLSAKQLGQKFTNHLRRFKNHYLHLISFQAMHASGLPTGVGEAAFKKHSCFNYMRKRIFCYFLLVRYIRSTLISAGLTPLILDACPMLTGLIFSSFSTASSRRPRMSL